jgi:hypothetical protein
MSEPNEIKRPEVIRNRSDAIELWKHLLARGITFHWDDDPGDWVDDRGRQVLPTREVRTMRRLFAEVDLLDDPGCYDDALSLLKLASLAGVDNVFRVHDRHASAFQSCSTPVEAIWILEQLH